METKAEYVTDDPLGELMDEIENCAQDVALAVDWRFTTIAAVQTQAMKAAKAALREYVDGLVKGGITAQIAENLEHIERLEFVVDGYQEQINALRAEVDAKQARIDALQAELASETRWAKQYHDQWQAALSDLRELQA